MNATGPKLNNAQRRQYLGRLLKLRRKGMTQMEVGAMFGISHVQVSKDERRLLREEAEVNAAEVKQLRAQAIADLQYAIEELWDAWRRSVDESTKQVAKAELLPDGTKGATSIAKTTEGQCGDASYITEIRKCHDQLCKLTGAYPAKRLDLHIRMTPEELEDARRRLGIRAPGMSMEDLLSHRPAQPGHHHGNGNGNGHTDN